MAIQMRVSWFGQSGVVWRCFLLALILMLGACSEGGYDGGAPFQEPAPSEPVAVVPIPESKTLPRPPQVATTAAARQMEYLNRGLVVVPASKGNHISWRLLATDNPELSFQVYRNGSEITASALTHRTSHIDESGQAGDSYQVRGLVGGSEVNASAVVEPWTKPYHAIALNRPKDRRIGSEEYSYIANDASAADLDGDGQYELILKWLPVNPDRDGINGSARDNAQAGITGNVLIDAYTMEGDHLWRIDLGHNIRAGAHYNPFVVYDFDGDGRAEMAVKTADGTKDGRGVVIGDAEADYRNDDGYILEGPEYLTMFDGLSGEALDTINYVPARGNVADWGDSYGNRVDRFLAASAYLDGQTPSLIMGRGVYTRVVVAAFDWLDGAFVERWVFDTDNGGADANMYGQGNHSLSIGDVDADGKDEIIYGSGAIDDNGQILYSTGLCDGDALHLGDLNPARDGLEVFVTHETPECYAKPGSGVDHGVEMHDAETGEILWSLSGEGADVGRGLSADIDPRFPGNESWASRGGLTAAEGTDLNSDKPRATNFATWWDGDLLRELLDGTAIYKWNYLGQEYYPLLNASNDNAVKNNGSKATPTLSADLIGDWREEVIWADSSSSQLLMYSSPFATNTRLHTLMHDAQYRSAIAWQNAGYNQPPHPSFYIGPNMPLRWQADITTPEGAEWAKLVARGEQEAVSLRVYIQGFTVAGIELFRDTDPNPEGRVPIATLTGEQRTFVDTGAVADVVYYYWAELTGSTVAVDMAHSRTQLTSTLLPSYWLAAESSGGGVGPVKLTWATDNIAISAINIYRVQAGEPSVAANFEGRALVASPAVSAIEWVDDTSLKNTAYYYWVEFVDQAANTTYKPNPTYGKHVPVPRVELSAQYLNNAIEIQWALEDFSPPIKSVEVYRNTKNTNSGRTRILRSAPVAGTYIDAAPKTAAKPAGPALPGVTYWYTLKVVLDDDSRPSIPLVPEAGVTIPLGSGLPLVGAWSETKAGIADSPLAVIDVGWSYSSIDAKSIQIFRDTNADGSTRVAVASPAVSDTSWQDTDFQGGIGYYYWVEVTDQTDKIYAAAPTPEITLVKTNLTTAVSEAHIEITWDIQGFSAEDIAGVELYRHSVNDTLAGRTRVARAQPVAGTFVDDGSVAALVSGTRYWYMFKLSLANGETYNTGPQGEVVAP